MLSLFSFFPGDMKREHTFLIRSLCHVDTWRATSSLQQKAVRTVWPPSNSHNTQVLSLHPPSTWVWWGGGGWRQSLQRGARE